MSKLLLKLSSSQSNKRSRLDTKFAKLTNSSTSSSPSLSDLHEIAIFSFNSSKVVSINRNLIKCLQIVKTDSVKALYKDLVRVLKALVIFQYLIQVGSEEFVSSWKSPVAMGDVDYILSSKTDENSDKNTNFAVLSNLLEKLETIENSNLCQDNTYTYSNSSSKKNSVRLSLSSIINKLSKLTNYLKDDEELYQFRLSFQKLRFDMTKPTPRSSMDHHPSVLAAAAAAAATNSRASEVLSRHSSSNIKGISHAHTTGTLIDLSPEYTNSDFDRIDFEQIEPNIDLSNLKRGNNRSNNGAVYGNRSFSASKSLDLNRIIGFGNSSKQNSTYSYEKESQKDDFRNFSKQILLRHAEKNSLNNNNYMPSRPLLLDPHTKGLSPLIEVYEPLS